MQLVRKIILDCPICKCKIENRLRDEFFVDPITNDEIKEIKEKSIELERYGIKTGILDGDYNEYDFKEIFK